MAGPLSPEAEALYQKMREDEAARLEGAELRTFDTTGTIFRRVGKVLTIICESDEIANRVADQLRTVPQGAPVSLSDAVWAAKAEAAFVLAGEIKLRKQFTEALRDLLEAVEAEPAMQGRDYNKPKELSDEETKGSD